MPPPMPTSYPKEAGIVVDTYKTVKLVSGTTVLFTAGDPMTTTAKTVVIGGQLAPQAKAYVVESSNVISLAFIVK